ncbi:hypothetical protein EYF80_005922 [Liparis tanakae]|uniref:Uncharacterized protein n=1 Tax=Liparis tanakae TaxID=230148 RepID=A0A4Z2J0R0_9TELE|nr:hypothetical protein EYF80_005922 [Liparis tanakae]
MMLTEQRVFPTDKSEWTRGANETSRVVRQQPTSLDLRCHVCYLVLHALEYKQYRIDVRNHTDTLVPRIIARCYLDVIEVERAGGGRTQTELVLLLADLKPLRVPVHDEAGDAFVSLSMDTRVFREKASLPDSASERQKLPTCVTGHSLPNSVLISVFWMSQSTEMEASTFASSSMTRMEEKKEEPTSRVVRQQPTSLDLRCHVCYLVLHALEYKQYRIDVRNPTDTLVPRIITRLQREGIAPRLCFREAEASNLCDGTQRVLDVTNHRHRGVHLRQLLNGQNGGEEGGASAVVLCVNLNAHEL